MKSEKQPVTAITVTCPTCHERLRVTLEERAQRVDCLYCRAKVNVPSAADAQARFADLKPTRPPEEIGEYTISSAPRGAEASAVRERAANKTTSMATLVRVECKKCHTAIEATPQIRERTVKCPECTAPVSIPSQDVVAKWRQKQIAPRSKAELGEFTAVLPAMTPEPSVRLYDALAAVRQEEVPAPPNWTFFSGVFSFPWRTDVVVRWAWMSFGLLVLSLFAAMGLVMLGGVQGGAVPVASGGALAFFALPMIWLTFWSGSYAVACFLCVVEETASGNDRISEWPEPHWKEWFAKLIYLMSVGIIPLVLSYGAGKLSEFCGGPFWIVMGATGLLLFPINLLSALDANSVWVPFTSSILLSLFRLWWGWLTVLVLSALIWGAWVASVIGGLQLNEFATALWTGPLLAAVILIQARLLGRLVWRASTTPRKSKRKKKRDPGTTETTCR